MKNYFLQIIGLAFAISPVFGQNTIQLNDSHDQGLIIESTGVEKNLDEKLLMEARSAHYNRPGVSAEANEPVEADALFVYPNPSNGVVLLKLTGKVTVYVYTLAGKFLQKKEMAPKEKILDLSALPQGAYHIMAKSDDDYFSGKLIIQ